MVGYVGRRLLQSLGVLLGVSVIVFGLLHLTGDPTRLLLPLEAREEDVRQLRALLGLDDPLWVQYGRFLARAVRGDFGLSFKHQVPALALIFQTLPATLQRSEEHTSELQSHSDLVCRLLLAKKKRGEVATL